MSELASRRSERRTRQRAANRASILEAARKVAGREGTAQLSLRAVAAEAGYAPASVYEYFRNRADLVLALAADDLAQATRTLREGTGAGKAQAIRAAFDLVRDSQALAAAFGVLAGGETATEAERLFNGRLIAALTALAEATGRAPLSTRDKQLDAILAAATLAGLGIIARAGRLKALGFDEGELLAALHRMAPGTGN